MKMMRIPCFLLLAGLVLGLCFPTAARARPTASFQKGLSPAAARLLQRVQKFTEKGDFGAGLAVIEKFSADHRGKLPPLVDFIAGNLNFQLDHYRQAAACYRRVVAAEPEFDEAYENLGAALLMLKQYNEAVKILLRAAARRPEKADKLKYQAALGALYGEDFELARKLLVELVAADPRPPAERLKALIQAELQLKDRAAAIRTAARLVDLYPQPAGHWRLYAQVLLAAGRYRRALSAYKVLQANGRLNAGEYKILAGIYQQLDLPGKAAGAWELYLAKRGIKPERKELETLVAMYRRAGEFDKALAALDRIAELGPVDDRLRFRRGEILYQAGRWRAAREVLSKVEKLPGQDGRQYLLAGYCAWNESDFKAAARAWEKAATYPELRRRAARLIKSLRPWLENNGGPEPEAG